MIHTARIEIIFSIFKPKMKGEGVCNLLHNHGYLDNQLNHELCRLEIQMPGYPLKYIDVVYNHFPTWMLFTCTNGVNPRFKYIVTKINYIVVCTSNDYSKTFLFLFLSP